MRSSRVHLAHLLRTKHAFRAMDTFSARVERILPLSATTKQLSLAVPRELGFQPGQWIDFIIPGEPVVGGYSICSAPQQLYTHGTLDIVVKRSPHPPAVWVHDKCQPGMSVQLRVGGDVFLQPSMLADGSALLFVAGGIGISPLLGMLRAAALARPPARTALLYTAADPAELIFREELQALAAGPAQLDLSLFATRSTGQNALAAGQPPLQTRRISIDDIAAAMQRLGGPASTHVFLCGPPKMLDALAGPVRMMQPRGVHFEKWW